MSLKIVSFNRTARVKRSPFEPLPQPVWLLNHLKAVGMLEDAYFAWHSWPTLETATFKLARLFGPVLKTHNATPIVTHVVVKAIEAFKSSRYGGGTLNSAAADYVAELLKTGETLTVNRFEACGPDPEEEVTVWDVTLGPYEDWVKSLPEGFSVTSYPIDAYEGEFKAGRVMMAGLILTASDYACLVYPSPSSTRGDL